MPSYVVKAKHPRRDQPLRITDKAGNLLAVSGEVVDHLPAELVESMIRNGYVEEVQPEGNE